MIQNNSLRRRQETNARARACNSRQLPGNISNANHEPRSRIRRIFFITQSTYELDCNVKGTPSSVRKWRFAKLSVRRSLQSAGRMVETSVPCWIRNLSMRMSVEEISCASDSVGKVPAVGWLRPPLFSNFAPQ